MAELIGQRVGIDRCHRFKSGWHSFSQLSSSTVPSGGRSSGGTFSRGTRPHSIIFATKRFLISIEGRSDNLPVCVTSILSRHRSGRRLADVATAGSYLIGRNAIRGCEHDRCSGGRAYRGGDGFRRRPDTGANRKTRHTHTVAASRAATDTAQKSHSRRRVLRARIDDLFGR